MRTPLNNRFPRRFLRGGLRGKTAILLCGFGLFTTLSTLVLAGLAERRVARVHFLERARANATFVERANLPPSLALARQLSGVLGVSVAFRHPNGEVSVGAGDRENWDRTLAWLAETPTPSADRIYEERGVEVCALPLSLPQGASGHTMIFRRESPQWGENFGVRAWTALAILPLLALLPALALARDLVRPLRRLSEWIPDMGKAAQPRLESVLRRPDEIGELARTLESTWDRLTEEVRLRQQSERLAMLGRMATSLAHEIKNPVAAIALHAELLRDLDREEREPSLDAIRSAADRIATLVHQWLFVVRPEPPRRESCDLRDIVAVAKRGVEDLARHHGVVIEGPAPGEALPVSADKVRVEHALRNVLLNGCQAMNRGGILHLDCSADAEGGARVTVTDGGPGFSPEALARFGEPFFSEKEGGMGLGLNLASEVIRAHGGHLRVANTSAGAEVDLILPMVEEAASRP